MPSYSLLCDLVESGDGQDLVKVGLGLVVGKDGGRDAGQSEGLPQLGDVILDGDGVTVLRQVLSGVLVVGEHVALCNSHVPEGDHDVHDGDLPGAPLDAGVAGAALLTALYCTILRQQMGTEVKEICILSAIAAVAGLISMVGDLCASAIKRNYDIKDYGHLIPGHGGILDRFDSMIITAPIIYYLSYYFLT